MSELWFMADTIPSLNDHEDPAPQPSPRARPVRSGRVHARSLQLAERIDLKGLERADQFSVHPMAFRHGDTGTVVLFRTGAVVFIEMTPMAEESIIEDLASRLVDPIADPESESAELLIDHDNDDQVLVNGVISLEDATPERLLLVAEALAAKVALAFD